MLDRKSIVLGAVVAAALLGVIPLARGGAERPQAVAAVEPVEVPPIALKTPQFDQALLAPVDGVGVRRYAHIVFDMFANDDPSTAKVLANYGLDQKRFDAVTAVMTKRMQDDPSRRTSRPRC